MCGMDLEGWRSSDHNAVEPGGERGHATQRAGLQTTADDIEALLLSFQKALGPSRSPCQLEGGLGSVQGRRRKEHIPVIHSSPLLLKGLGSLSTHAPYQPSQGRMKRSQDQSKLIERHTSRTMEMPDTISESKHSLQTGCFQGETS